MVPIASGTEQDLNTRIHKTLEEKGIETRAYKKCPRKKYGNASLNAL